MGGASESAGSGVGGRRGPAPARLAAHRCRCDPGPRSLRQQAGRRATWKKTFGYHPLLAFVDRPEISGGEAVAGMLRNGNAGSNTASDHVILLARALASLPARWRPDPDNPADPDKPRVLIRSDTAGATHRFAQACRSGGVGFSFGYPVDVRVQDAVDTLNIGDGWYPAIDTDGGIRDGAWVAEATDLVNLDNWPAGTRLILRKERPHPGAQLRFTDADGMRVTAFITDTEPGPCPGKSPVWNYGTASMPASKTASANSKPPGYATCRVTASGPTPPGWKSCWPPLTWSPGPA